MADVFFELDHVGPANRLGFFLKSKEGEVFLSSQLREMKPMCMDEMKWIRKIASKDSSYERIRNEKGNFYVLRAGDGHELGRGIVHSSEERMEEEIAFVKQYAAEAGFVDKTPEEGRIKARDYIIEKTSEILEEKGMRFG